LCVVVEIVILDFTIKEINEEWDAGYEMENE
jgi:hypothetical protein